MSRRYFTVAEVNRLLPRIQTAVEQVQEGNRRLTALSQDLYPDGKPPSDTVVDRTYLAGIQLLTAGVEAIGGLGGQVKDVRTGLVDFPSLFQGREVLLCWMPGEDAVGFWHDLDAGFAGRAPIEDAGAFHGDPSPEPAGE